MSGGELCSEYERLKQRVVEALADNASWGPEGKISVHPYSPAQPDSGAPPPPHELDVGQTSLPVLKKRTVAAGEAATVLWRLRGSWPDRNRR